MKNLITVLLLFGIGYYFGRSDTLNMKIKDVASVGVSTLGDPEIQSHCVLVQVRK